jgi:hypothetical protein
MGFEPPTPVGGAGPHPTRGLSTTRVDIPACARRLYAPILKGSADTRHGEGEVSC